MDRIVQGRFISKDYDLEWWRGVPEYGGPLHKQTISVRQTQAGERRREAMAGAITCPPVY